QAAAGDSGDGGDDNECDEIHVHAEDYPRGWTGKCGPAMQATADNSTGLRGAGHDVAGSRWFGWLGRAGIFAQGAIHAIIGVLAIEVAVGLGGKTTNQSGAMTTL